MGTKIALEIVPRNKFLWYDFLTRRNKVATSPQSVNLRLFKSDALSVKNHNLEFLIEDNDPGIQEQEKSLIFEPFYRAETSRNSKGIGLGLNLARSIINAHKGIITLENSSMGGAAFRVVIPVKTKELK